MGWMDQPHAREKKVGLLEFGKRDEAKCHVRNATLPPWVFAFLKFMQF